MKIYNEVITQFNDITEQWETLYEDSYQHNGPVALAQGTLPANATAISAQDTIADTIKTTAGYFTDGDGTLSGDIIHTGSLAASNEKYYFNVTQTHPVTASAQVQFSVTFGHVLGSGSNCLGDTLGGTNNGNTLNGETEAIYKQFTNLLLEESEASGGFKISAAGSHPGRLTTRDEYIYVLVGKRARFKDRINKKAWTLILSGSLANGSGSSLTLTDDSAKIAAASTPAGPRHNIVSGALGAPSGSGASDRCFGWFYPEMGVMLFSGHELTGDIPGMTVGNTVTASFDRKGTDPNFLSSSGFKPNIDNARNSQNALRFVNCLSNVKGNALRMRSEEDQSQENFFCRIKASQYNFSANPTFVSGSYNKLRNTDMFGNPSTFITGVGLYNSAGQLLAIAKLSSPLKKNFASEATVKVKLTY